MGLMVVLLDDTARAGVIFDNGAPDQLTGAPSDFDIPVQQGDDFTFASAQTIRDVHWWGTYTVGPTEDDFTIRISNIVAGVPEVNPTVLDLHVADAASRIATGNQVAVSFDEYAYSVVIPDTLLGAGTYLLSIINNTPGAATTWFWTTSSVVGGNRRERNNDGEAWQNFDDVEFAFNLTDDALATIPEPGTLALFGVGLAGLAFARRRRTA